jgi:hypothetical protein
MTGATSSDRRIKRPDGTSNFTPDSLILDYTIFKYDNARNNYVVSDSCLKPQQGFFTLLNSRGSLSFPDTALGCASSGHLFDVKNLVSNIRMLASPPSYIDTITVKCAIVSDTITVTRLLDGTPVQNAMVIAWRGQNYSINYTNASGKLYNSTYMKKDTVSNVFIYKPGYRKMLVYPYGTIQSSDTLQGDVTVFGDIRINSGKTLSIKPGTNIFMATSPSGTNHGFVNRTEFVVDGDISRYWAQMMTLFYSDLTQLQHRATR